MKYRTRLTIRRIDAADFGPPLAMAFEVFSEMEGEELNVVTLIELSLQNYIFWILMSLIQRNGLHSFPSLGLPHGRAKESFIWFPHTPFFSTTHSCLVFFFKLDWINQMRLWELKYGNKQIIITSARQLFRLWWNKVSLLSTQNKRIKLYFSV